MATIQSKIKGALYGFAIGDAMGATTEFMHFETIKKRYGEVKNIIGGGWLNLKPGEVTDDTQMMLCVCEAIEHARNTTFNDNENFVFTNEFLDRCCENFVKWYESEPKDVGGCCSKVISQCRGAKSFSDWHKVALNPDSLGNGSLMRTLPIVLAKLGCQAALSQGRLTHNNNVCDHAIDLYYRNIVDLMSHGAFSSVSEYLAEPTGHVLNTLINSLYWVQHTYSLEDAIVGAVNHGGDADTIAAITGSLAGALYGYDEIPQRWIDQLSPEVKKDLDKYAKLFENF